MFRNILIPTDGSRLAAKGIRAGVKLAKALGARVTGVYVAPPYRLPLYEGGLTTRNALSPVAWRDAAQRQARKVLAEVEIEADAAKVPCQTRMESDELPWRGILSAAKARRCDAIVISSHGRGSLGGMLLGSETSHVLSRSKIPVVVLR
jgi:nucleotide-binding universal stress UspA family protein